MDVCWAGPSRPRGAPWPLSPPLPGLATELTGGLWSTERYDGFAGAPRRQESSCRACIRHTFVTTMLDAGVDLRDVQIAARHADPRTTMRYDRARQNLDRHPNDILAAYMASET